MLAALALGAVVLAVLRPTEQEAFRAWLRDQPGVLSVDEPRALASGVVAARVFEPTVRAKLDGPVDVTVVDRLGRAVAAYGARHPAVAGTTVELQRGADAVLVSTRPEVNATSLALLRAMEDLPSLVSVAITAPSDGVAFTATVRAGSNLPAAATALARVLPEGRSSWITSAEAVAARDDGVGHGVQVARGATVAAADTAAFALAMREDPTHRVTLVALGEPAVSGVAQSVIRLSESPLTASVAAALHHSGYGLSSHGQSVVGPSGAIAMDERAWATSAGSGLSRQPGVLAARVDAGSAEENRPVVADLRVEPTVSLEQVLRSLPEPVERVEVHTSAAAPDYDRDDALTPDPEVDCPTATGGGLNLAYSGPRDRLPKATNYLSALRAPASGATCVHWTEASAHGRPTTQTLLVRLPLAAESWRPVLDVVLARRADLGSAHPAVILLLPLPAERGTAVFNLPEGEAPYVTTLEGGTTAADRASETALAPLVRYWSAR